ncbi:unnamed protein product [Candidula unifasciata]|uniref:Uncharacterized protein n=1 Tax=Candidula unifasciata TaxID=100452 RepID=A0A8S3Z4F5_9EUPU|nr:unnamed protein product [Candidula unifasciata]
MFKILSLLFLVGVTYSQIPQPCFSPPLLSFVAIQYDQERVFFRQFDAAYDFQGQRFAFYEREDSRTTPGRQYYQIIILHKENVAYQYNRQSKQCTKSQAGPFRPFGVPPEGRFEGEYYIGGPGETIEAVEWSDRSDVRRENWLGVFTRINCYPVRTWLHNSQTNETVHTDIFNVVAGVTNPSIFEPPTACRNATVSPGFNKLAHSLRGSYRH